jgi:hypothetical protein
MRRGWLLLGKLVDVVVVGLVRLSIKAASSRSIETFAPKTNRVNRFSGGTLEIICRRVIPWWLVLVGDTSSPINLIMAFSMVSSKKGKTVPPLLLAMGVCPVDKI